MKHDDCPKKPKGNLSFYTYRELSYEACDTCGMDRAIVRHGPGLHEIKPSGGRGHGAIRGVQGRSWRWTHHKGSE